MRRRLRFLPLALLLTGVVEIAVFLVVSRWIGFVWAVLLVLAVTTLGLLLVRREGMRAWRGFRDAVRAGQPPGDHVVDGLVGLLAAVLLAVPGLVTGVVGLLLEVPPGRGLARAAIRRTAERRIAAPIVTDLFGPRRVRVWRGEPTASAEPAAPDGPPRTPPVGGPGPAIEGEIVEPRQQR